MVEVPLGSAEVAELADASASKSDVRKDVRVRLPLSAQPTGPPGHLPVNGEEVCLGYGVGTIPGIT
jgi:hypothetical protein